MQTAWSHLQKRSFATAFNTCGQRMRPDVAVDLDHQVVLTIVFRNSQILGPMQFHPRLLNQGRVRWERCEINPNAPTHNHPFWIFHGPSPQPAQPAWSHLTKKVSLCLHSCSQLLRPDDAADLDHQVVLTMEFRNSLISGHMSMC